MIAFREKNFKVMSFVRDLSKSLSNTRITKLSFPVIRKSCYPEEMKKYDDSEISMILKFLTTVETYEFQHDCHLVVLDQDPMVFPY